MTATYLDLLHSDGSVNPAAFASILETRIAYEVNLALVSAAGIKQPRGLSLEASRIWRAGVAMTLDQSLVSHEQRARIAAEEAGKLNELVNAMQAGAAKQREAMSGTLLVNEMEAA